MKKIAFCILLLLALATLPSLQATLPEVQASWDARDFYICDLSNAAPDERVIETPTIYFAAPHPACYGHALLDGVVHLYAIMKEHDLLDAPINLLIMSDSYLSTNPTFCNVMQFIKDVFHFNQVIVADKDDALKRHYYFKRLLDTGHIPFAHARDKFTYFSFYKACPESYKYITELKACGVQDNVVLRDANNGDNIVKDFIDYVIKAYKIDAPVIKNRVLITDRKGSRLIKNLNELCSVFQSQGYVVALVDFEKLPIRQQIVETIQSEYLVGTYGSNLVNAMFLKPGASVVILWHKYAKYFWSRKYCIIHSAFLSAGVQLIESDKPDYDPRDTYTEQVHVQEYFYRTKNRNYLRPEKTSFDEMLKYPLPAMYEITNVDMYIDPNALISQIRNIAN